MIARGIWFWFFMPTQMQSCALLVVNPWVLLEILSDWWQECILPLTKKWRSSSRFLFIFKACIKILFFVHAYYSANGSRSVLSLFCLCSELCFCGWLGIISITLLCSGKISTVNHIQTRVPLIVLKRGLNLFSWINLHKNSHPHLWRRENEIKRLD